MTGKHKSMRGNQASLVERDDVPSTYPCMTPRKHRVKCIGEGGAKNIRLPPTSGGSAAIFALSPAQARARIPLCAWPGLPRG